MNKNKIYLTLAVLSLTGMLGQYVYYETQEAQASHETSSLTTYTKIYTDKSQIKTFEAQENVKGCTKLHTDFTNKDGSTGILTFTCDSRDAPPTPEITMTQNAFIDMLADERGINIFG